MVPEIWLDDVYLVDGDCGTDVIPVDVCGEWPDEIPDNRDMSELADRMASAEEHFRDYTENTSIYSVDRKTGWCYRLTMPGYLDCTETGFADSEAEAIRELLDLYGGSDQPEAWEAELEERLTELGSAE